MALKVLKIKKEHNLFNDFKSIEKLKYDKKV